MKLISQIEKPDDVEVTISATMTLAEWKKLKTVISDMHHYVPSAFHRAIRDAINQTEQRIFQQQSEETEVTQ